MHILAVNSVATLLNYLAEHLKRTPSTEDIEGWRKKLNFSATDEAAKKADDKTAKDAQVKGPQAAVKPTQTKGPDGKITDKVNALSSYCKFFI